MTSSLAPLPPPFVELRNCALRIRPPSSAERLWNRYLKPGHREQRGGDLEAAYYRFGTAGMWAEVHSVTPQRAVVEVAKKLGFLRDEDYEWLLRETGEIVAVEEAISAAITAGDLVLVERPREAYWNGNRIEIDWCRYDALWGFFWELSCNGKVGQPIDVFTFRRNARHDIVAKRKYRLTNMEEFPWDRYGTIQRVQHDKQIFAGFDVI